jgi:hypothetical protein
VASADVDLASKQVAVHGDDIEVNAVWAAVEEAGYEPES